MTSPMPSSLHQQTEPGAQSAVQHQQQERLTRLFRQVTGQPDDQHLRALISRYRGESPS